MIGLAVATGCAVAGVSVGHAADPQPYRVEISDTDNGELDSALADASRLVRLRDGHPVGPFPLITRARQDIERLRTVLRGFGYYAGKVSVEIDDYGLTAPELPQHLTASTGTALVAVEIDTGPRFVLGPITVEGDVSVPAAVREALEIESGQPAIAADVLAARERMLKALHEEGYALARVPPPDAILHRDTQTVEIVFNIQPGRPLAVGPIMITGLTNLNESFVRAQLPLEAGDLYQPSRIEAARRELAKIGVVQGVTVEAADEPGSDDRLRLTFKVEERLEHAVGVTGAYSTDLGFSAKLSWTHRNLFGNAERLQLSAAGTGLGGSATSGLGYDVSASLAQPYFLRKDQTLQYDLRALEQDLDAYSERALSGAVTLRRQLSDQWSASVGMSAEQLQITQQGVTRDYTLLGFPLTGTFDNTGLATPLAEPTQGWRAQISAAPIMPLKGASGVFAILQAAASTYYDIGRLWGADEGDSVLALRGLVGSIVGADRFDVPPDKRFYGGGSATVRGFAYQSVGPEFDDGTPAGGAAIDAATVEFRQRVVGDFGAVAFVDAGQVNDTNVPFGGTLRVGAGVGVRYYTAVGPIRFDIAAPLNKPSGGDSFAIYIGLGQAF